MNEFIEWAKALLANHDELEANLEAARQAERDKGHRLIDVSYAGGSWGQEPTRVYDYETKKLIRYYADTDSWLEDKEWPEDWAVVEAVEEAVYDAHEWFAEPAPKGFPQSLFNIDDVDYDELREWLEGQR